MSILDRWKSDTGEKSRFIIVGGFGALISLVTYSLIYRILPFGNKATIAWVLGYLISIIQQHSLHRKFTFFSNEESFISELIRAYVAYSLGLVISTAVHAFLTINMLIHHYISWFISTGVAVISNYLTLKFFVYNRGVVD